MSWFTGGWVNMTGHRAIIGFLNPHMYLVFLTSGDTVNVIVHCPHPRPSIFVITLVLVAIIIVIDLVVFVTILLGILNCSSTYQS